MINKNIKKILNEKNLKNLNELNLNLRPTEINEKLYYKITEVYERKQIIYFYLV